MTAITLSTKAKTPEEVISELRSLADFIEAIGGIKDSQVVVTGDLNLEIRFAPEEEEVAS